MTRTVLFPLTCLSLMATLYIGWGCHRLRPSVLMETQAAAAWPSPDPVIRWLYQWYEDRAPPPPEGMVNIHGELPRVRSTFRLWFQTSALLTVLWASLLMLPPLLRRTGHLPPTSLANDDPPG